MPKFKFISEADTKLIHVCTDKDTIYTENDAVISWEFDIDADVLLTVDGMYLDEDAMNDLIEVLTALRAEQQRRLAIMRSR